MPAWAWSAAGRATAMPPEALPNAQTMYAYVQKLVAIRRAHAALAVGDYSEMWRPNGSTTATCSRSCRAAGGEAIDFRRQQRRRAGDGDADDARPHRRRYTLHDLLDAAADATTAGGALAVTLPAKTAALYRPRLDAHAKRNGRCCSTDRSKRSAERLRVVEGALPGMPLKRRMSAVKLDDGSLVVHSAIALDPSTQKELEAWGMPRYPHRAESVAPARRARLQDALSRTQDLLPRGRPQARRQGRRRRRLLRRAAADAAAARALPRRRRPSAKAISSSPRRRARRSSSTTRCSISRICPASSASSTRPSARRAGRA